MSPKWYDMPKLTKKELTYYSDLVRKFVRKPGLVPDRGMDVKELRVFAKDSGNHVLSSLLGIGRYQLRQVGEALGLSGVSGYWNAGKARLIGYLLGSDSLRDDGGQDHTSISSDLFGLTIGQLKSVANRLGVGYRAKARKKDLVNLVAGTEGSEGFLGKLTSYVSDLSEWVSTKMRASSRKVLREKFDGVVRMAWEDRNEFVPRLQESALQGFLSTYRLDGKRGFGYKKFLELAKGKVVELVTGFSKPVKVMLVFTCEFHKGQDVKFGYFHSTNVVVTESTDLSKLYDLLTGRIVESVDGFQNSGSGWVFVRVNNLDVALVPYEPTRGGSYLPLPKALVGKKAVVNVRNEDDQECLKWAITSAIYPAEKNPQRLTKKVREDSEKFVWDGIGFPSDLKDVGKFERSNPHAVNVLGCEGGLVYPLRISDKHDVETINLLLIANDEGKKHY